MRFFSEATPLRGQTLFQAHIHSDIAAASLFANRLASEVSNAGLITEKEREKYVACFEEAVKNAIIHGNKQQHDLLVYARVFRTNADWGIVVEDQGFGFDKKSLPNLKTLETPHAESRQGIKLIRHVMDEVEYYNGGRTLILTKELDILEFSTSMSNIPESTSTVRVTERNGITIASLIIKDSRDKEVDHVFDMLDRFGTDAPESSFILDFSNINYLNSHGLGRLISFFQACNVREQSLCIACLSDELRNLFEIMNIAAIIMVYNDVEEALEAVVPETQD